MLKQQVLYLLSYRFRSQIAPFIPEWATGRGGGASLWLDMYESSTDQVSETGYSKQILLEGEVESGLKQDIQWQEKDE